MRQSQDLMQFLIVFFCGCVLSFCLPASLIDAIVNKMAIVLVSRPNLSNLIIVIYSRNQNNIGHVFSLQQQERECTLTKQNNVILHQVM